MYYTSSQGAQIMEGDSTTSTKRDSYNYWHTPYLGLNNIDTRSSSTGCTTIYDSQPSGFVEIDVTAAVKAWKHDSPNYGVAIWATS